MSSGCDSLIHGENQVAVIGGGPGGLCMAKYVSENGMIPVVFEKNNVLGGLWSYDSPQGAVYEGMKMNTSRLMTEFTDFPTDPATGDFPSCEDFMAYLNAYLDQFDIRKYCILNATVTLVSKVQGSDSYTVIYKDGNGEKEREVTRGFKYVVCAVGAFSVPVVPEDSGTRVL